MRWWLTFLLPISVSAQNLDWATTAGGVGFDYGIALALDDSGNVYSTGYFADTCDFETGPGTTNLISAGNDDIFLQKLNSAGILQWVIGIGGSNIDQGRSVALDNAANVFVTGSFVGTVDFDPGPGVGNISALGGNVNAFVCKFDRNGNFLWARAFQNNGASSIGFGLAVDSVGDVLCIGTFGGLCDFDPGAGTLNFLTNGLSDAFICKLNANGNLVWAQHIGGTGFDNGEDITVDALGNIYATGNFADTVDFDFGVGVQNRGSSGSGDIFILKLDSTGAYTRVTVLGGVDIDHSEYVCLDGVGNMYITGRFTETVDFDPGAGITQYTAIFGDIYVLKLDTTGAFVWVQVFNGFASEIGRCVQADAFGNVYITGTFAGTVDFDPGVGAFGLTAVGLNDIFIVKLNAIGNMLWAIKMGGTGVDEGLSMALDAAGNLHTTGWYDGIADFYPGPPLYNYTSVANADIFVQKLQPFPVGTPPAIRGRGVLLYPNPATGAFTVQGATGTIQVYDLFGRLVLRTNERQVDMSHQPKGIYIVKSGELVRKLILN